MCQILNYLVASIAKVFQSSKLDGERERKRKGKTWREGGRSLGENFPDLQEEEEE